MDDAAYRKLLQQARAKLPPSLAEHKSRFQVPDADVVQEGRVTFVRNMDRILAAIRREPEHVIRTLLGEMGRAGVYENGRFTLQGLVPPKQVRDAIKGYIDTFVICDECGAPDTHFEREHRVITLRCEACGGHRPVRSRRKHVAEPAPTGPKAGDVLDVQVTGEGRQGDGVARIGSYVVFIVGARRGETCKARVTRVSGTSVFAEKVPEPQQ